MNRILLHSNIKTWFILLLFSALNKLDAQTFFDLMKRSDSLNLTISDKTSGIKKYYHKSDLVAEGKFKNGSKDSTWNFYYENGALLARGGFKDDKMVGPWLIFN